jgi:hypothetical protein
VEFGGSVAAGQTITFSDTTGVLKLDDPADLAGTIADFSGTDPAHSDQIDLAGINYNAVGFSHSYNSGTGVLTVADGTNSATLKFTNFTGSFNFAADSAGTGTLVTDPPAAPAGGQGASQGQTVTSFAGPGSDNFVIKRGLGAETIVGFDPQHDTIAFEHFAGVETAEQLLSAITSDAHGNAMIALGHGDSVTIAGMSEAQLLAVMHLQNATPLWLL